MASSRYPGQFAGRRSVRELKPPPAGPAGVVIRRRRRDDNGAAQPTARPHESGGKDNPQGEGLEAAPVAAEEAIPVAAEEAIPVATEEVMGPRLLAAVGHALVSRGDLDLPTLAEYYNRQQRALLALYTQVRELGPSAPAALRECYRLATDAYQLSHAMFAPLLGAVEPAQGYNNWEPAEPVRPLLQQLDPASTQGRELVDAAVSAWREAGRVGDAEPPLVSVVDPDADVVAVVNRGRRDEHNVTAVAHEHGMVMRDEADLRQHA
jgi:hypothetical protein